MNSLMCHLVAGYPTDDLSRAAAAAIIAGGAAYLEVQFPFSDPTADGPLIQEACTLSLEAGFTVEKGFRFLADLAAVPPADLAAVLPADLAAVLPAGRTSAALSKTRVPVFLMTYASLAVRHGIPDFLRKAKNAGVRGLIIPDLPFDSDEGLFSQTAEMGIAAVPVLVPGMSAQRLSAVLDMRPEFAYVALRSGITGSRTVLAEETLKFLEKIKSAGVKVFAGFGINSREQVETLGPSAEAAVVGSHIVGIIKKYAPQGPSELSGAVARAVAALTGKNLISS